MEQPAMEVDPTFFLRVVFPGPVTVQQAVALRRVGPGLASKSPGELLNKWRGVQEVRLGPYLRKYQAMHALEELISKEFSTVELLAE